MAEKYVPIFLDWLEMTCELTAEEKGRLIDAIVSYARGDDYQATGNERFILPMYKAMVDRSKKIGEKRSAAGASGGFARASSSKQSEKDKSYEEQKEANDSKRKQTIAKGGGDKEKQAKPTEEEEEEEKEEEEITPHKPPKGESVPKGFEDFWALYPRKTAKQDAIRAWRKLNPDLALQEKIRSALTLQISSDQWTRDGGQFIPHPATWLNGGRWDDEPIKTGPPPSNRNAKQVSAQQYGQRDYSDPSESLEEMLTRLNGGVTPEAG